MENLSYSQLIDMMSKVAVEATKQTLQQLGLLKPYYTRAEVETMCGTAMFQKSKKYVKWKKTGPGRTSSVTCDRLEFERFLSKFNEELKTIEQ